MRRLPCIALSLLIALSGALAGEELGIVICAPGYPGSTAQAQETMDDFARGVRAAAGWSEDRVHAVYFKDLEDGIERLEQSDATVAMVPLPFYLEFRERLRLTPILEARPSSGPQEIWSVVARRGALVDATTLEGWELVGMPGYAPRFVRNIALAGWAAPTDELTILFSKRVLSGLRKAAAGDPVAVLLDRGQVEALSGLAFAEELEVVTRSRPMIASVVCAIGDRLASRDAEQLSQALLRMHETDDGSAILEELRLSRFDHLPVDALGPLELAHEGKRD